MTSSNTIRTDLDEEVAWLSGSAIGIQDQFAVEQRGQCKSSNNQLDSLEPELDTESTCRKLHLVSSPPNVYLEPVINFVPLFALG